VVEICWVIRDKRKTRKMPDPMTADDYARISRSSKSIHYPDFKPKQDFTLWLAGYREKVRSAINLTAAQNDLLDAEIVRTISSKLESGTALDTYTRLTAAEKADYATMVGRLTEEFLDPQEKRKFVNSYGYNRRKKGQSLKEFMQEIIKDMGRYSNVPDRIQVGGVDTPNPAKEADGVRRFKRGLRTKRGERSEGLKQHMSYHLQEEKDLTWKKALDAAGRWEVAADGVGSESKSEESDESEVEVEAVCAGTGARSKQKTKRKMSTISSVEQNTLGEHERSIGEVRTEVATLVDQVKTNTMDLKGVKTEQERTSVKMDEMMKTIKMGFDGNAAQFQQMGQQIQQQQQQQQYQPRVQQQYQPRAQPYQPRAQPYQPRPQGYQQRNQNPQPRNTMHYTWKGRVNQNQQTGFGLQARTPQNYQQQAVASQQTQAKTVATVVDDMEVETPEEEVEQRMISMPEQEFINLTHKACVDVDNDDMVAAVSELNFG